MKMITGIKVDLSSFEMGEVTMLPYFNGDDVKVADLTNSKCLKLFCGRERIAVFDEQYIGFRIEQTDLVEIIKRLEKTYPLIPYKSSFTYSHEMEEFLKEYQESQNQQRANINKTLKQIGDLIFWEVANRFSSNPNYLRVG